MGDAAVPHTPSGHKGAGCGPPLWKPLLGMGERQRKEKQRVSSLQPDKCLSPRCGDALRPSANFQRSRQEAFILAAVRTGRSFVWVSWPVSGQLIPDTFSFPPCTAHSLFRKRKRKWGDISHGKAVLFLCRIAAYTENFTGRGDTPCRCTSSTSARCRRGRARCGRSVWCSSPAAFWARYRRRRHFPQWPWLHAPA